MIKRHPSLPKAWLPPVVGSVTRTRNKPNLDPDDDFERYEYHMEEQPGGLYKKVIHTENYQVRVIKLPCGCEVPEDEVGVEMPEEEAALAAMERQIERQGFAIMSCPDVSDLSHLTTCPRCKQQSRIIDEASLELEASFNEDQMPGGRQTGGWV